MNIRCGRIRINKKRRETNDGCEMYGGDKNFSGSFGRPGMPGFSLVRHVYMYT